MDQLETLKLDENIKDSVIYALYADDLQCAGESSRDSLFLLSIVSQAYPSIQFTIKNDSNQSLHMPGVTLRKKTRTD